MNKKLSNKKTSFAMSPPKGFTLIELLVVIAIIGILSSIVLVSMGGARNKAKDAAIKSYLSQTRSIAEMEYDSTGSYAGLEAGDNTDYEKLEDEMQAQGGTVVVESSADTYCIESTLNSVTNSRRCVDSTGEVRDYTKATTDCDTGTCDCAAD